MLSWQCALCSLVWDSVRELQTLIVSLIKTARCQCCGDSVLLDASLTVALEAAVMATCCLWPRP